MAQKAKVGDGQQTSTNLTTTKKVVRECVKALVEIDEERSELNERAKEYRERCKTHGIPGPALNLAIKMMKMEAEDREALDESYAIARDALGIGMQASLFEMIETPDNAPPPKPAATKSEAVQRAKEHLAPVPDAVN